MKKNKSLREYGEYYGVSHELIRKIKAEGINPENESAVKSRISETVNTVSTAVNSGLPLTVPETVDGLGLRAAIERLKAAEKAAHADYLNALENAPETSTRALKAWQTIVQELRRSEVETPGVEKDNGENVTREELARVLGELFRNLRTDLEAMPRKMGLTAGDKRDVVEKAASEEINRIIDGLYACKFLTSAGEG